MDAPKSPGMTGKFRINENPELAIANIQSAVKASQLMLGELRELEPSTRLLTVRINQRGCPLDSPDLEAAEAFNDVIREFTPHLVFRDRSLQAIFEELQSRAQHEAALFQRIISDHSGDVTAITFCKPQSSHWFSRKDREATILITLKKSVNEHQVEEVGACAGYCREQWGLSRTECRLSHLLASGMTVSQSANILGLARSTARSYLKIIFQKTDCHSQNALTHKMNTFCS